MAKIRFFGKHTEATNRDDLSALKNRLVVLLLVKLLGIAEAPARRSQCRSGSSAEARATFCSSRFDNFLAAFGFHPRTKSVATFAF